MKKLHYLLAALLLGTMAAHAVPAKRQYAFLTQPDGSKIEAMLVGDEHGHYYVSRDGKPLMMDNDNVLRYAYVDANGQLAVSNITASQALKNPAILSSIPGTMDLQAYGDAFSRDKQQRVATRKARLNAPAKVAPQQGMGRFTSDFPRTGKVRSLVLLVEYSDVKFTTKNGNDYFKRLFNEKGFKDGGHNGSVRDFFLDQSNGAFDITYDVYGPVTLKNKRSYYGNNVSGDDIRPEEMAIEAADQLNSQIDFSLYDYDNNGEVDNIFVVYAGVGENVEGAPAESVWPHAYWVGGNHMYDGKKLWNYCCVNEWEIDGRSAPIGTFVHEFGHVIGLPDLYSTTNSYANWTPNEWDTMDYASYNNDGRTPANFSAYERNALTWIDPIVLNGPTSVNLEAIHKSNTAYLIPTEKNTEFFLFENRQQEGWDAYLPHHGMLVWHIDFVQSVFDNNVVNNTSTHSYVDIVEAGGKVVTTATGMRSYPFPGSSNVTSFTSSTTPALRSWAKKEIALPITNIKELNKVISFDVDGGLVSLDAPAAPTLELAGTGAVKATWDKVNNATSYRAQIFAAGSSEPTATQEVAENTCTFTGLMGETEYSVRVSACRGSAASDYSPATTITTGAVPMSEICPTAKAISYDGGMLTMEWNEVPKADHYLISVEAQQGSAVESKSYGFGSGSTLSIPTGWTWTGASEDIYGASSSGYFGQAGPSLKFKSSNHSLTSCVYDADIQSVGFTFRGASTNSGSIFYLEGRASENAEWKELFTANPVSDYNSAMETLTVKASEGIRQIRFRYYKSAGNVALDDVVITMGTATFVPVATLTDYRTDAVTSVSVPFTPVASGEVRFNVKAVDAQGVRSLPSEYLSCKVESGNSGILDAKAANTAIALRGNVLTVTAAANATVTVYTTTGATVAALRTDSNGIAATQLPTGFYLVATPGKTFKLIVR